MESAVYAVNDELPVWQTLQKFNLVVSKSGLCPLCLCLSVVWVDRDVFEVLRVLSWAVARLTASLKNSRELESSSGYLLTDTL